MAGNIKKKTAPIKECYPWIEEVEGLYYCKVWKINPAIIRSLCSKEKEEFFINKGVPKNSDPGRKADVHLKHPSHHLSIEYDKLARGEKKNDYGIFRFSL